MKEYENKIKNIIKRNKWIIIAASIIIILLSLEYIYDKKDTVITLKGERAEKITVYLKGAVKNEGSYYLEKGGTVEDLLNISGGILEQADLSNIKLNKKLANGDIINIKIKEKYTEIEDTEIEDIETEEVVKKKANNNRININNATKGELMELYGIGEKTAQNIIEYRNSHRFNHIEDIKNVKGIGDKKYEKIKNEICI